MTGPDTAHAREVAELRAEVERLRVWKDEALPVMAGLQELGRALGVSLGSQITARASVDLALDLRNERDDAVARAKRAEAKVAAVAALADEFERHARLFVAPVDLRVRQDWEHVVESLRAVLADPAADDDTEGTS